MGMCQKEKNENRNHSKYADMQKEKRKYKHLKYANVQKIYKYLKYMQMSSRFILFVIQPAIVAASKGVAEKIWSANKIDQYSEYSSRDVKT